MLKRKRPLDEMGDTSELLERELENGVQIEWIGKDLRRENSHEVTSALGGVLVIREDISFG
jgi:hypothetical protein